jgi:hypothetical protein
MNDAPTVLADSSGRQRRLIGVQIKEERSVLRCGSTASNARKGRNRSIHPCIAKVQ